MKTTAIVVNWNNSRDTLECITSLQESKSESRIVVVDNGSEKEEVVALESLSGITLILIKENLGFGRGNNVGIRRALSHLDCEYIFLLNNDAICDQDALSILEEKLDRDSDIGIVAPRIVYYHEPEILWYGGGEISWTRGSAKIPGFRGYSRSLSAMQERDVTFASGCAMLIRRKVFEDVGGFDPRFFMYEEDLEFSLRVGEAGWRIHYEPNALVRHKVQGRDRRAGAPVETIVSPRNIRLPFFMFNITKNRLLNMLIHARGFNAVLFLTVFPLLWMRKSVEFLCFGRFDGVAAVFSGIISFYRTAKKPFIDELK